MKFVLASHNKGKLAEMQKILGELGVEVVLQSELGLDLEPEETGETFLDNARIKARAVMEAGGLPAIADDSGLCVDALNGAPGVYSARYGGLEDDAARCRLLLQNMRGSMTRAAHFHTSVVCVFPTARSLRRRASAPAPSPMPLWATGDSAMIRCSSIPLCARPLPR